MECKPKLFQILFRLKQIKKQALKQYEVNRRYINKKMCLSNIVNNHIVNYHNHGFILGED